MAAIKSFTDLQQSKKLADILPLESADNYYSWHDERYYVVNKDCPYPYSLKEKIPCWSLAALLDILPSPLHLNKRENINGIVYWCNNTDDYDNPIDACYELILKLHKLNLL